MIVWQVDLKITYNNMLSYDYKIKPLRDASDSKLFPAVINYRVTNGQRDYYNKINREEARAIVALLKACIEQPEYEINNTNKTIEQLMKEGYEPCKRCKP